MISFLEMVQHFPIGCKVRVTEGEIPVEETVKGYEYYNGTGYLLAGADKKLVLCCTQGKIEISVKKK